MAIPSVEIDGITFRVISYNPQENGGRSRIVYESSAPGREPELYAAYRSLSEMGFWRLCLGVSYFEKGLDYVQSSYINIELQKYFDTIIRNNTIPLATKSTDGLANSEEMNQIPLPGCTYSKKDKHQKIKDHLNNQTRIITIEELRPYLRVGCGVTKAHQELFKEISDFMESSPLFNVESVELIYPGYTFTTTVNYGSILSETVTLQANIYCCNFTSNVRLYFMKYDLQIERDVRYKPSPFIITAHFAPLLLIPKTATITEFGTYSQYISGGLYICKIFDYSKLGQRQVTLRELETQNGFGDYKYIGNRYTNLFPYKYMKLQEDRTLVFVRPQPPSPGPLRIRAHPAVRALIAQTVAERTGEISPKSPRTMAHTEYLRNRAYRNILAENFQRKEAKAEAARIKLYLAKSEESEAILRKAWAAKAEAARAAEAQRLEAQRLEAQAAEAQAAPVAAEPQPPSEKPVSDPWAGYSGGYRKKKTRRRKNRRRRTYKRKL